MSVARTVFIDYWLCAWIVVLDAFVIYTITIINLVLVNEEMIISNAVQFVSHVNSTMSV